MQYSMVPKSIINLLNKGLSNLADVFFADFWVCSFDITNRDSGTILYNISSQSTYLPAAIIYNIAYGSTYKLAG